MVQRLADGIYAARDADEAAAGQPLTYEFEHLIGAAAPSPGARETEALAALDHVARVLGIAPRETLDPRQ